MLNFVFCLLVYLVDAFISIQCQGGRQYSIGLMEHKISSSTYNITIVIINSNTGSANVDVSNNALATFPNNTYVISGDGGYESIVLTPEMALTSITNKNNVIIVSSDINVDVIVCHYITYAFDGFLAVPDQYASNYYTVISYCNDDTDVTSKCMVTITSLERKTTLFITMPSHNVTLSTGSLGENIQTTFQPYEQTEETMGPGEVKFVRGNDLTGMKIHSSEPVHVLTGCTAGKFYDSPNTEFHETIMLSEDKWGLSYIVVKWYNPDDRVWIFASENNTNITIYHDANQIENVFIADTGQYVDYIVTEPVYIISADKRIGIVQFPTASRSSTKFSAHFVTPVEQFSSKVVIRVPESSYVDPIAWAIVYTDTKWIKNLSHNRNSVTSTWQRVLCSKMSFTGIEISLNETHVIQQHGPGGSIGGYLLVRDYYSLWSQHLGVSERNLLQDCNGPCHEIEPCNFTTTSTERIEHFSARSIPTIPYFDHFRSSATTKCFCSCQTVGGNARNFTNGTSLADNEMEMYELQKNMTIDKRLTSQTKRKKTSADDSRSSSKAIGSIAVIILVISFWALCDIRRVITDIITSITLIIARK